MADNVQDGKVVIDKADNSTSTGWKTIFNFTERTHFYALVPAILLSVLAGILQPAMAIFFGKFFDAFSDFGGGRIDGNELMKKSLVSVYALLGVGAGAFILKGGLFTAWLIFGEMQAKNVRDELFQGLLEKNIAWYESKTSGVGTLLARIQTQIRDLQIGTSQPLGFCVNYTVQAIASLGLAFFYNWKLTFVILAGMPVIAVVLAVISHGLQGNVINQDVQLLQASKLANNAITNIFVVKCFNTQDEEVRKYVQAVQSAGVYYVKQAFSNALQIGFVRFASTTMFVQGKFIIIASIKSLTDTLPLGFWFGGSQIHSGSTTAGKVITTFWSCLMATKAFEDILPHLLVLEKGKAAAISLKDIVTNVKNGPSFKRVAEGTSPQFCEGDVEVREVSFSYPSRPDQHVLQECSFFFPAGETSYVVGRSGSGKSTLGNLLMRFYDPSKGSIFIDGHAIECIDTSWLRNNITLVQQQSILFNETIFRNIAFGNREYRRVTDEEIQKCLSLAALQETIVELPKGIETRVGVGGSSVSGGQKQRIAIARARLRDTPILILDESTSALDYVSRTVVMDAIREWRSNRTTIIITHDLTQIKQNDFVYVLESGSIVSEGYRRDLELDLEGSLFKTDTKSPIIEESSPLEFTPNYEWLDGQNLTRSPSQTNFSLRHLTKLKAKPIDIPLQPIGQSRNLHKTSDMPTAKSLRRTFSNRISAGGSALVQSTKRLSAMGISSIYQTEVPSRQQSGTEPTRRLSTRMSRSISVHQAIVMRTMYQDPEKDKKLPTPQLIEIPSVLKRRSFVRETDDTAEMQIFSVQKMLMTVWPELDRKHRIRIVLGFLATLTHAASPPAFSYILVQLFATFYLPTGYKSKELTYSLAILGVAVLDAVSSFLMHYNLEDASQMWVDKLRVKAIKTVIEQPKSWFDDEENTAAFIISALDRNAEDMRNLVGRFAAFIVVVVAMMLIAIIWSFIKCWKVTLVGLAAAPVLYVITKGFEIVSSKWENRTNNASEAVGAVFTETFSDIRTVRALTLESYFHKKYTKATTSAFSIGIRRAINSGFFFGLSDSAINFITALIFYYGALVVKEHEYPVKSVLTVFSLLLFSTASANAVVAYMPQIASSVDTGSRLLRLAQLPLTSHEYNGHIRLDTHNPTTLTGPIHFINQTFFYPTRPEVPALDHLNLTIPGGQCTAIVGSSGSGKSTIASLLLGFYPTTSPSSDAPTLTLSGRDIRQLHLPTLRSLIAIVPQTPVLFPTTVRQNIAYGLSLNSDLTTTSNIERAACQAGIHEFIISLPQGYATIIGDGGLGLSGGQAQRIVIARALLRRPRILILDEATSALDRENAGIIRRSILDLVHGGKWGKMTVIIITHAKEMMQIADNVVVLEKGQVVEEGSYRSLLRNKNGKLSEMLSVGGIGLE